MLVMDPDTDLEIQYEALTPEQIQERLSAEDIRELRKVFELYDKHNLGYIPKPDLRDMLSSIGYNLTNSMLDNLVAIVDVDNNGKIDFDEFIDLIANLETEEKHENDAMAAFNTFDYKGDGKIRREDIKTVMNFVFNEEEGTKGENSPLLQCNEDEKPLSEEEKEDIMGYFRLNSIDDVHYEEFKEMVNMMKH